VAVTVAGFAAVAVVDEMERTSEVPEVPVPEPPDPLPEPNGDFPALLPPPPQAASRLATIETSSHFIKLIGNSAWGPLKACC
jgi:hypothetical protein